MALCHARTTTEKGATWPTLPDMRTATRAAVAVAAVLILAALGATFLPASPAPGLECGTWVAPEWDADTSDELVTDARGIYQRSVAAGRDELAGDALAVAADVRRNQAQCGQALDTRRTVAMSLAGLAIILPAAVMFTAGRRRREETAPTPT